jgi:serine/threonine protein kinase
MSVCSKCGAKVPEDIRFCPQCGHRQAPSTGETGEHLNRAESAFEEAIKSRGRYSIKRLLGRGGMGLVYHAFDSELGIEVAIKSLPPELSGDPHGLRQLREEAKLSMQLTHHNIVRLYDLKEAGYIRFLVMEYVPGFTLSEYLLVRGRLGETEAWEILKQAAQALDYAHSQKVIHRDIKPGNFLFKTSMNQNQLADYFLREGKFPPELVIKLADFGIARTLSDSISRLSNVPISGTLSYMSREQVRGKAQTPATDIYSLAVVAYELLNGTPPFHQGEITYQILNEEPELIPGVKPEYMMAIIKGLSKNPEDRPSSASEFLSLPEKLKNDPELPNMIAKAAAAAASPSHSRPESLPPEPKSEMPAPLPVLDSKPSGETVMAPKIAKQQSALWIAIAVVAVLAALSVFLLFRNLQKPAAHAPGAKPQPAKPGPRPTPPPPMPATLTELVWKAGKNSPSISHKGRVNAVAFNPGGSLLASGGEDGTIRLWNVADGSLLRTLPGHNKSINSLSFGGGGRILASAGSDGEIKLWSIPGGEPVKTISSSRSVNCVRVSPAGSLLAFSGLGMVRLAKFPGGELLKPLKAPLLVSVTSLAFNPRGKTLAAGGLNSMLQIFDLESGESLKTIYGPVAFSINSLEFSPGGGIIAAACSDKIVRLWNAETGKSAGVLTGHKKAVRAVAFSRNGNLASAGPDGIRLWNGKSGVLIGSIDGLSAYALSWSGNFLASGGCPEPGQSSCEPGEVRLYKVNW